MLQDCSIISSAQLASCLQLSASMDPVLNISRNPSPGSTMWLSSQQQPLDLGIWDLQQAGLDMASAQLQALQGGFLDLSSLAVLQDTSLISPPAVPQGVSTGFDGMPAVLQMQGMQQLPANFATGLQPMQQVYITACGEQVMLVDGNQGLAQQQFLTCSDSSAAVGADGHLHLQLQQLQEAVQRLTCETAAVQRVLLNAAVSQPQGLQVQPAMLSAEVRSSLLLRSETLPTCTSCAVWRMPAALFALASKQRKFEASVNLCLHARACLCWAQHSYHFGNHQSTVSCLLQACGCHVLTACVLCCCTFLLHFLQAVMAPTIYPGASDAVAHAMTAPLASSSISSGSPPGSFSGLDSASSSSWQCVDPITGSNHSSPSYMSLQNRSRLGSGCPAAMPATSAGSPAQCTGFLQIVSGSEMPQPHMNALTAPQVLPQGINSMGQGLAGIAPGSGLIMLGSNGWPAGSVLSQGLMQVAQANSQPFFAGAGFLGEHGPMLHHGIDYQAPRMAQQQQPGGNCPQPGLRRFRGNSTFAPKGHPTNSTPSRSAAPASAGGVAVKPAQGADDAAAAGKAEGAVVKGLSCLAHVPLEDGLKQLWSGEQLQCSKGGSLFNVQQLAWHPVGEPEPTSQDMVSMGWAGWGLGFGVEACCCSCIDRTACSTIFCFHAKTDWPCVTCVTVLR